MMFLYLCKPLFSTLILRFESEADNDDGKVCKAASFNMCILPPQNIWFTCSSIHYTAQKYHQEIT